MDFTAYTIDLLKILAQITGNFGWGIILLTVLVRLAMWHSSAAQQRSMRTMQQLQPKMKAIQDRYKSNPQMMQQKMMEFYKENKFNPMAGCWPMLIQMPIFILLYSALMSPVFVQIAGNESFYFIKRLDETLKGNAGISYDNVYTVTKNDTFSSDKNIFVSIKGESEPVKLKISNPRKLIKVQGDILPGEPLDLKISLDDLDLKYSQLEKVTSAQVEVINNTTREIEKINFTKDNSILKASIPTKTVESTFHIDVLVLIIIFGLSMVVTQKIMMAVNKNQPQDPTQAAMQKTMGTMMPIMLMATFVFIPIPAGVLLYLISSNLIQILQTIVINKQLEIEDTNKNSAPKVSGNDIKARKVDVKAVKNVESSEK